MLFHTILESKNKYAHIHHGIDFNVNSFLYILYIQKKTFKKSHSLPHQSNKMDRLASSFGWFDSCDKFNNFFFLLSFQLLEKDFIFFIMQVKTIYLFFC